ncbi:HEAT repeat domain-containing protein, partial [Streptomyces sp. 15-116A]|uniref:HEAT repeat domain-containing protein n=1 Tax=Streptomyces sp. 15-116A TaxID=2259035 RepID=UPI0037DA6461|nr:HEAT repeat domain-containing protein [Streptomyces sp. 15-116A]
TPLLRALAALGDGDALPVVLRLTTGLPAGLRLRDALLASAVRTLGALGEAAGEAIPVLRGLLDGGCGVAAAEALWSIEGDAEAVLPVLLRELRGEGGSRAAAEALGRLGPAAGTAVPGLHELTRSGDPWERTTAACSLWRITGEPSPSSDILRTAWRENPYTRVQIATLAADLGSAANPLHDLLRTELSTPHRHRAAQGTYTGTDLHEDEALLRECRRALGST